jgi:hypothetical protein
VRVQTGVAVWVQLGDELRLDRCQRAPWGEAEGAASAVGYPGAESIPPDSLPCVETMELAEVGRAGRQLRGQVERVAVVLRRPTVDLEQVRAADLPLPVSA